MRHESLVAVANDLTHGLEVDPVGELLGQVVRHIGEVELGAAGEGLRVMTKGTAELIVHR